MQAETAAEFGEVLKTERFIRNFAVGENMPFTMRAIEFARDMAQNAQNKLGTDNGWRRAAGLWAEALNGARSDAAGSGKRYYTHVDDNGNKITVITDNQGLFAGVDAKEVSKTAAKLLTERYKNKVIPLSEYGLIHIRKTGINKYLHSTNADENAHLNKLKAAGEFENLLLNAEYLKSTSDKKNHSFAKYGFDHYKTVFAIDGQVFEGIIDVGISEKGAEFYGMTNVKRVIGIRDGNYSDPLSVYKSAFSDNSSDNRIAQNAPTVNNNIRKSNENDTQRRKLAEPDEILNRYGIKNVNDYIEVQRKVQSFLSESGFYSDASGKSRTVTNKDSGMVVEINNSGIKETFGNGKRFERLGKNLKLAKILTIEYLPQIIQNGRLISDNVSNYHGNASGVKFAYIEGFADNGESPVSVKITIRKSPQKNKFWLHQVDLQKKSQEPPAGVKNSKTGYNDALDENSISQKNESVKGRRRKLAEPDLDSVIDGYAREMEESEGVAADNIRLEEENAAIRKSSAERAERLKQDIGQARYENNAIRQRLNNVLKENAKLNQRVQTLTRFFKETGEVHISALNIRSIAEDLKKKAGSHVAARDIAVELQRVYTYMSETMHDKERRDADGVRAYEDLYALAERILSEADVMDRSMYDHYEELRTKLRNDGISISKRDKADIADFNEFRKHNAGKVKITENGTPVDTYYEELLEVYPELFSSEITHPADRLKEIARVRDMLDAVKRGENYSDEDAAALAGEMFANYFSDENAAEKQQKVGDVLRREFACQRQ